MLIADPLTALTRTPSRKARAPLVFEAPVSTPTAITPPVALKPPLKWAGGKRWLVKHLRPVWESDDHANRRYVEPFCGGLAAPLGLTPKRAILNDNNAHVINFYRQVQHGLSVDIDVQNDSDLYYQHRAHFNTLIRDGQDQSPEAAALFYYLNRTGYNGLCRFNRKGEFNVPFGKYKTINYAHDFAAYQAPLSSWEFTAGDFQSMTLQPDDFVYADPPYDVPFVSYSKFGFSWNDQVRLAEWLSTHTGPVIISNQATDRILELYRTFGYNWVTLQAPRRISCNGNRTPATEVLAFRNVAITLVS